MISPINPARHKDTRMKLHYSSVIFLLSGSVIMASFLIPTKLPNLSGDSTIQKNESIMRLSTPPSQEIR
jgi:hypothetical protein